MKAKSVRSLVLAGAAIAFLSVGAFAQNGRFSVGAEVGLPTGNFGKSVSLGFGGSLRYEMPMGDNLGFTGTVGYLTFSGKSESGFDFPNISMIPIQVGAKYYFEEQQNGFYGMLELGMHISKSDDEDKESSVDFSYAPGVGYHLANIDLGLSYQVGITKGNSDLFKIYAAEASILTSYLGLRIAYVFGEK